MNHEQTSVNGRTLPILAVVVPCYDEEDVLPETARRLGALLDGLIASDIICEASRVVFIDDGSRDRTWVLIEELACGSNRFGGIKLSRNVGHQNALLCGLLNTESDALISMDADLQDDVRTIREMLLAYIDGADIVYGVRRIRQTDTVFKRLAATSYYRLLQLLGVNIIFNHADFRLMSRRAIKALHEFGEVNLFLRGIVPQLGFNTKMVMYDRLDRFAGESKYSIRKMLALGVAGITSFSIHPLRWITIVGVALSVFSLSIGLWALFVRSFGNSYVPGWASTVVPMYFLGGIQLLSLGIIGEYLGRIYMETKRRPRFIVEKIIGVACNHHATTTDG